MEFLSKCDEIGCEKNKNAQMNTNTVCVAVCMNKNALVHIYSNIVCVVVCMNNNVVKTSEYT